MKQEAVFTHQEFIALMHDTLMEQIEPELCSYNLEGMKQKYADETQEEAIERLRKYSKAYDEFFEMWDEYQLVCMSMFREMRKDAFKLKEESEDSDENDDRTEELEDYFDDISDD